MFCKIVRNAHKSRHDAIPIEPTKYSATPNLKEMVFKRRLLDKRNTNPPHKHRKAERRSSGIVQEHAFGHSF
jgi:hypothetical protein